MLSLLHCELPSHSGQKLPTKAFIMDIWRCLSLIFLLATIESYAVAESKFLLTFPKSLYSGSKSEFCLIFYDDVKATFTLQHTRNTEFKPVMVEDKYISGEQKCTPFKVPSMGDYNVILTQTFGDVEESALVLHNSTMVTVFGSKLVTFVQTDKPIYKPGQKVMFRVFTLMRSLKPRINNIKSVYVIDPNDVRVKQFLDVETKGIGSFEFQLIDEPKLGKWKIEVYLDDEDEVRQTPTIGEFRVEEYVLPRFEVIVTTPKYVLYNDAQLRGQVCAQYTYGKPVTGTLHLELKTSVNIYSPYKDENQEIVKEITGCYNFTFNITSQEYNRYYSYKINASVTEQGTGVSVHKFQEGPSISYDILQIEIDDFSKGFFKPGLPYYGKVLVKKNDDTPVAGEAIKLTAVNQQFNVFYEGEFVTDSDGTFIFSLCGEITNKTPSVHFTAEATNYNGTRYSPRGYKQIQQWFSPSLSYLQIPLPDKATKCGDKLSLNIPFTTKEKTPVKFFYQVMGRGKMLKTGHISFDETKRYPSISQPSYKCLQAMSEERVNETSNFHMRPHRPWGALYDNPVVDFQEDIIRSDFLADKLSNFVLSLEISSEMSPQFSLLVYHILPDGEVVADGRQFDVEPCFDNQVKMVFSESSVVPGNEVNIKINAEPESVCAIGVVDKSVNILGGNHQVTPERIFQQIEEMNPAFSYDYYTDELYCRERLKKSQGVESLDEYMWLYSSPFVDAFQAFKMSGFKAISNMKIETRPCSRNPHLFYDSMPIALESSVSDLIRATENIPLATNTILSSQNKISRTHFPETWLWDMHIVGKTGEAIVQQIAPHTITNWIGNVLCVHQQKGFGVSPITSLRTFQPFFLSLNLPYAAVRGEKLSIMITVYNYLEKCLHIQLSLDVEKNFAVDRNEVLKDPVCVCSGQSYTSKIYMTAKALGQLPITAKAEIIPGLCSNSVDVDTQYLGLSDSVQRMMFVKAEGIEQTYSSTKFMCSKGGEQKQESLNLSLPVNEEIVKDSSRGEVKIIGDIMGPALTNLDNLVRLPTGCGEQNMVGFVPNIFALKYLMETGKITDEIKSKALKNMETGYQRQLTFRHNDGSYSAFGRSDNQGSIWLTAFVVKSYAQAQPYIFIDKNDLQVSLNFLRRSQLETGCYRETGKVISSYMMGGLDKKDEESFTSLTAYVVIALLTAGVNATEPGIYGAMECIYKDFDILNTKMDPYTLALVTYANILYSPFSQKTSEVMTALESIARTDGDLKYWARNEFKPKVSDSWFSAPMSSAEVEMTAYVLLAYLKFYGVLAIEKTHNIAMWLSKQRNPYGGFSSTQDTVIGLNALSDYARLAFSREKTELKVSVTGEKLKQTFNLSEKKKTTLLLHRAPISVLPNEIQVTSVGEGCAIVQFSVYYNKQAKEFKDNKSNFHLKVTPSHYQSNRNRCDRRSITISIGAKGLDKESSGMAMVDLKLVTGWTPVLDSLTKIKSKFPVLGMKKIEYKESEGVLSFYFDELSHQPKEFIVDVEQDKELIVSSPKPADVKVYYYYETDIFMVQSYAIKTTCGTKQEIPYVVPEEDSRLPSPVQVRINPGFPNQDRESSECPLCISVPVIPQMFKEIVCNSSAVYKVIATKDKIKLLQDLRPSVIERKLNIFVSPELPSGCNCKLITENAKRAVIIMQAKVKSQAQKVQLEKSTVIIADHNSITRAVREHQKTCPVNKAVGEKKMKPDKKKAKTKN